MPSESPFRTGVVATLLPALVLVAAPNTYHPTSAIWGNVKRCNMHDHASELYIQKGSFGSKVGGWQWPYPAYTHGEWVAETAMHPSVAATTAVACDKSSMCGNLGLSDCTAASTPDHVCSAYHRACYADRRSPTFAQNVENLKYVWQPSNGCRFSPVAPWNLWRDWAARIESDAGKALWVGDSVLGEMFMAFQGLTGGAPNSGFVRSDTLVNSYTLAPMTASQIARCV